jgi:hypothetical protein
MLKVTSGFLKINTTLGPQKMQFWGWVNMMFNKMDNERIKSLGYERCTAEW